jgi:GTPase involved in cell partitioning and DNA repair
MLRFEAGEYDPSLVAKPHVVALTKADLHGPEEDIPTILAPEAEAVVVISAVTKQGLQELNEHLWRILSRADAELVDSGPRL